MSAHGPFDADELVRWAETYGHPEEWAKKAQDLHAKNERLRSADSFDGIPRALGLAEALRDHVGVASLEAIQEVADEIVKLLQERLEREKKP